MMSTFSLSLLFALLLQTPPPAQTVIVCLLDGQQIVMENPEFTGFIQGRSADAVLIYRHNGFHGEMPVSKISRIEFGPYQKGGPFAMLVTLRNGEKLNVLSEYRGYVMVRGNTEAGSVTIKHPDPISTPIKLSTRKPNRKNDLTIQYLEFPAS
jgi:hypothetical protein